ncbi:MAG TPA: type II toxin-antitoxin system RelE/ParE family toxin [Cyclobacteriaceae bacterium]|nr:type II toxin-antitoxin system RelE/ParE family toxin [Cyclobacteriaceae bacterium]
MVKVIWTEFAVEDLRSIHSYISKDSKVYADRFIEKLISKVEQLEAYPNSGRVVPEFNLETIRELIEGNYRIVYTINADAIGIVRVHHSARQLKGL